MTNTLLAPPSAAQQMGKSTLPSSDAPTTTAALQFAMDMFEREKRDERDRLDRREAQLRSEQTIWQTEEKKHRDKFDVLQRDHRVSYSPFLLYHSSLEIHLCQLMRDPRTGIGA
jgi:hypothetical protein